MKIHVIDTGLFKLDGGAMFGVVPKQLWKKINTPDDNNMCTWAMRCLLVEDGDRKILIDTGLGDKQDSKFRSHFEPHGEDALIPSIRKASFAPEDITDVLLTHMHFDHVGGAVKYDGDKLVPTFPNATYWSNEKHYNWAIEPNYREKASFLKENIVPLMEHGVLKFLDTKDGIDFSDNIKLEFKYGHTEAMMIPFINLGNGKALAYTADLLPSHGHVGMPYVMSYDIRPLDTLKEKHAFFENVLGNETYIMFEHDKDVAFGALTKNDRGRVVFDREVSLQELLR